MTHAFATPFTLPCGAVLKNRLAKAAMTEGLADAGGMAHDRHVRLYRRWAAGGAGLLLSGNVMVDRHHLERPGNVVIDGPQSGEQMARLKAWAQAGTGDGAHLWMQLSHSGRQTRKAVNPHPHAPSAVKLALPGGQFGDPRALTGEEIEGLVGKFAGAAGVAREAGFTGVQIHGAHGYLISEFLSPRVNRREDEWGGGLEGRARFLLAIVMAVRARVGADFPLSVKLNSADFQKGGFTLDEAKQVARWLEAAGVDLLEISGGTYEQPQMMQLEGLETPELPQRESTRRREAFFLDYAKAIRETVGLPLMVTGGFRSASAMDEAIERDGISVIGIARPLCMDTDGPARLLAGESAALERSENRLRLGPGLLGPASPVNVMRVLNGLAVMGWYYEQLYRMGEGKDPDPGMPVWRGFLRNQSREARVARQIARAR
ncbi:MAG: NADH:flavin oxidoreductase/NADH oxidase family protein [Alphaproteobacteria bacterium]